MPKRDLDELLVPASRPVMVPRRKCEGCTACCFTEPLLAMEKPAFTRCAHDTGKGCGIYSQRPTACRVFECLWLHGVGTELDRPDLIGVLFAGGHMWEPTTRVYAFETTAGALDRPRGALIKKNFERVGCEVVKRTPFTAGILWMFKKQRERGE